MTKQGLSKFFIIFIFGYLILLVGGIFLYKTNRATYQTHSAKQFEDYRYFSQRFNKNESTQFASRDGEVQAFFGPAANLVAGYVATKVYTKITSDAPGFAKTQILGVLEKTAMESVVGCSLTEFQKGMEEANSEDEFINSGVCPGIDKSPLNNINPDKLEVAYNPRSQGLLGLYSQGTRDLSDIETNGINDSLYAQHIIKQIPIVGEGASNKVFAAGADTMLSNYALGEGFFRIWKTTLNFTYYLIIIPTVAFGFAIMFRMQINPQTQITLMRAIPKLLIAILLITFSYPIASLMLRLGKVISDVSIGLIWSLVDTIPSGSFHFSWLTFFQAVLGNTIEGVGHVIIVILFVIIFVINLFRWLFAVFRSLIAVGFLIAFAPLILLFGAFPGKDAIIVNYFKNLGGEILGYFGMYALLAASFALLTMGTNTITGSSFLVPLFFGAMSLSVLWKSPSAPKLIKGMIGVEPLFGGGDSGPPKRR